MDSEDFLARAARYQKKAQQMRQKAMMTSGELRTQWVYIAETYERLADEAERLAPLMTKLGKSWQWRAGARQWTSF